MLEVTSDAAGNAGLQVKNTSGITTSLINSSGNSYFNGGNVGIGTTSPISKLQVGDNTFTGANGMFTNARVGISNHGSLTGMMLASTYNDATHPEYGLVFVQGPSTSSYNVWSISPDGPLKGDSLSFIYQLQGTNIHSTIPKVVFDGNGNVGIGPTSRTWVPETKLHIAGTTDANIIRIENTATALSAGDTIGAIQFFNNDTTDDSPNVAASIYATAGASGGSGSLRFKTIEPGVEGDPATEAMIITNGGNVGIGTTNPLDPLNVQSTGASDYAFRIFRSTSTTQGLAGFYEGSANQGQLYLLKGDNTAGIFLNSNGDSYLNGGDVGIGTTSPGALLHLVGTTPELRIATAVDGDTARLGLYEDAAGTHHGGYIQYVGSGDTLRLGIVNSTVNTDVITIKDNFNVGIGTTSPTTKLNVSGDIAVSSGSYLSFIDSNISYNKIGRNTSVGGIQITTGASATMNLLDNGNVGIGTTSPGAKLDVAGTVKYNTQLSTNLLMGQKAFIGISSGGGAQKFKIYKNTNTTDGYARFKVDRAFDYGDSNQMVQEAIFQRRNTNKNFVFRYDGDITTGDDIYLEVYELSNGQVEIWLCVDDYAQPVVEVISNPSTSEIFTSTSAGTPTGTLIHSSNPDTETPNWNSHQGAATFSGNVGIGTTSPGAKLQVDGGIRVADGTKAAPSYSFTSDTNTGMYSDAADAIKFTVGGTDTLAMNSSNNVGIGTSAPDVKFHVTTSEDGSGIDKGTAKFINTNTGQGATTMHVVQTSSSAYANAVKFWQGSTPTAVGFIRLTTSATQFITSASDLNLKKNITIWSDDTLSKFKSLEPKKFRFKTQDTSEDKTLGFIAQNEVDNFPEAYPQFLGEDEKPYYGFNPTGMVPHLMKAIKDLVEKVETLENKITQLENNN